VSIQAFVEGLLRLANVLEATNWTLKNVNNICTLAINSTNYLVLFSGDLTGIRWRVLHMSTTFAVFVSTGVTLAYRCAGLEISVRTNRFLTLFGCLKATMGGAGKLLYCLDCFSTDAQSSRMVLKLFLRGWWYVRTQWVLLHLCFSLYWNKLPLELLWALFKLFFIILC
jgi:hypothetical protein